MKLYLLPHPGAIDEHNGIGRVVHAQYKYLPKYGFEFVNEEAQADLVIGHTHQFECAHIDVLHLHGIYWTGDPKSGRYQHWHNRANRDILASCRRALKITVPSYWVGEFLRRDFRIQPTVIGHGIDVDEWKGQSKHDDFVFWAKNRPTDVCDPAPMYDLAYKLPETTFVTTFGPVGKEKLKNIQEVGGLKADDMNGFMHHAKIYLATTHETWGITTAEALACGVPVLGFRWGGTPEIVEHKVTGWLAEPGDIDGLVEGYHYLIEHWDECSAACLEAAPKFSWDEPIKQYAALYEETLKIKQAETHKVSIVITSYNYAHYLPDAIKSALNQSAKCEVVVVNDGSKDNTAEVAKSFGDSIVFVDQPNQGVAAARNNGIAASTGDYIICLDADDMLDPMYAQIMLDAMKADRGLGIAYSGLRLLDDKGNVRSNEWPPEFRFEIMADPKIPPSSCIHCASMFRRKMFDRAGGYRQVYAPAEDTEFWVRGLANGFTAKKVTEDALFTYRVHEGSALHTKKFNRLDYWHPWMRDKLFPAGAPASLAPLVRSYSMPVFTIAFDDWKYGYQLMEMLLGQTFRRWEAVYIGNEFGLKFINRYPFVKVCQTEEDLAEISSAPLVLKIVNGAVLEPDTLKQIVIDLQNKRYQDTIGWKLYEIEVKEGVRTMPCSGCGGQLSDAVLQRLAVLRFNEEQANLREMNESMLQASDSGMIRMRFIGENAGAIPFGGPGVTPSGLHYHGGNNSFDRFINADPRDVEWLKNSGYFIVQPLPEKPVEPVPAATVPMEIKEMKPEVPAPEPTVAIEYKYSKKGPKRE